MQLTKNENVLYKSDTSVEIGNTSTTLWLHLNTSIYYLLLELLRVSFSTEHSS